MASTFSNCFFVCVAFWNVWMFSYSEQVKPEAPDSSTMTLDDILGLKLCQNTPNSADSWNVLEDVSTQILIENSSISLLGNNKQQDLCTYYPDVKKVDLSSRKFVSGHHQLTSNTKSCAQQRLCHLNLTKLVLRQLSGLRSIRVGNFSCCMHNVTELDLCDNHVTDIDPEAFSMLTALKFLNISQNSLTNLSQTVFVGLKSLEVLNLTNNKLEHVEFHEDLANLKDLVISHNDISGFHFQDHTFFSNIKGLLHIHFTDNNISSLPEGLFQGLKFLESLDLRNNNIERVEKGSLEGLATLTSINMDRNSVKFIDNDAFRHVSKLLRLSLSHNRLQSVPKFAGLGKLRQLFLKNNQLETVNDKDFQYFDSLEDLDLSYNRIRKLSRDCFKALKKLAHLDLRNNLLENTLWISSPDYMPFSTRSNSSNVVANQNLLKVSEMHLSYNKIHTFHCIVLIRSNELVKLKLDHNSLTMVHMHASFTKTVKLQVLDFSYNSLHTLDIPHVFLSNVLVKVQEFNLSNNLIERIHQSFFVTATKLQKLDLSHNRLKTWQFTLPPNPTRTMRTFTLGHNPWVCDCHLLGLKDLVDSKFPEVVVTDNMKDLECAKHNNRFRQDEVALAATDLKADFMCPFVQLEIDGLQCSRKQLNETTCNNPRCPETCRCYRSQDWEDIVVDCHGLGFTVIPEMLLPHVEKVFLDNNKISTVRYRDFDNVTSVQELYLNDSGLLSIERHAFTKLHSLHKLFLQNNLLQSLPEDIFLELTLLVELDLSHNKLKNLDVQAFTKLTSLQSLLLGSNLLTDFPVWTAVESLPRLALLELHDNPWTCECHFAKSFISWMFKFPGDLVRESEIYCQNEGDKMYFSRFDESVCMPAFGTLEIAIVTVAGSSTVLVVLLVLLLVRYRHELRVFVYSRYGVRMFYKSDNDGDENKVYDALVSYSSLDEAFIVHNLVPGFEDIPNPYKLCLHNRDFAIGAFINENIIEAIDKSCRTIVVLTDNYVKSDWCRFEFLTAHAMMLEERRNRVIVVLPGDVPKNLFPEMRHYLRTKTYLCWNDKMFWEKLYFVLPNK